MNHLVILLLIPCSIYAQQPGDSARVHALLSKGGQAARTSNYDSARYYYTQAENLSRAVQYKHGIMSSTFGHGLVHHYQRELGTALEYYLKALEMTKEGVDLTHPDVILLYNNLGGVHIDLGYRIKARAYLEKTLEMKEASNDFSPISAAITQYNLGLIHLYFGENQSALHSFMSAYPAYLDHYGENGARVAQLYTNVGGIHRDLGNIELAEEYFQRGITIHMENHGPDYWNLAYPYTNLGSLYMQTDQSELALDYYLKSLELCKKNRKQLIRLESLDEAALAQYYLKEGDYQASRNHANAAVTIMQEAFYPEHPRISEFYQIIGQTHVKQGQYTLANQWFDQAKDLTIKGYGAIHPQIATLYLEQSKAYLENKDYQLALQAAQNALISMSNTFNSQDPSINPRHQEVLNEKLLINVLTQKGSIFLRRSDTETPEENLVLALEQYRSASEIIDYLRRGFLSESAKLFLQTRAVEVYQQALETCFELHRQTSSDNYLDLAFYFMEKSKSSVLSESLQASQATSIQGVDPSILNKEIELSQLINSLELKLTDAQIDETDSIQKALKRDLFHTRSRVDSLEDVIRSTYPNYHQLKYNTEVVDLNTAKASIPEETLVLSFFESDSVWYVLSFDRDLTEFKQVRKSDLPEALVDNFRNQISDQESDPKAFYASGQVIYQKLLQPILESYQQVDRLILVPDGSLSYLPFDALTTKQLTSDSSGTPPHFMLEDYAISYRNSLTLSAQQASSVKKYDQAYIGFAPDYTGAASQIAMRENLGPLPGARNEVVFAGSIFKGLQYLDSAATEKNLKQLPYSTHILHLAMHALVDDQEPMRSRLILSQGKDSVEDGSLNAYEIYQLPLRAELAVLSACNTGTGKINRGEGVLSISRAFMYAGCPNIVMSLWRAQDQPATEIMSSFFENLKKGLPKDQALRQAKLAYLKTADPFKAHPANWATFVLVGESAPLSKPNNPLVWLGLGALTLVLVGLYYKKRKKDLRSQT